MQSAMPRAPLRLSILVCAALASTACAGGRPIVAASSACSALLPQEWRQPVPGAPLPTGETVGDWVAFGDAQTGQLDKANDRTVTSIGIIERCEERDKAAIAAASKGWWQFWR